MDPTAPTASVALSDVEARSLAALAVQAIALLLTASPIIAVGTWSILAWL